MPDAVVIGAGPNGLVAANLLADRGWSVTVRRSRARARRRGALGRADGARVRQRPVQRVLSVRDGVAGDSRVAPRGVRPAVAPGAGRARASGERRHLPDPLDGHRRDRGLARRMLVPATVTRGAVSTTVGHDFAIRCWPRCSRRPRRSAASARLAMSAWSDGWTRVARFALLSVRRMGEEEFGSDAARRLLAGSALHADLAPEAVLGGFFAWVLCALGQDVGWPVPEGGSGRLTAALVDRLRSRGGEVVCDAPVDRIVIRDRRAVAVRTRGDEIRATRAVLADVAAPALYLDLVGSETPSGPRRRRRAPLRMGQRDGQGRLEPGQSHSVDLGAGTACGNVAPRRECRRADRVELVARTRADPGPRRS